MIEQITSVKKPAFAQTLVTARTLTGPKPAISQTLTGAKSAAAQILVTARTLTGAKPAIAQTLTGEQIAALSDKDLHARCQNCGNNIRKFQKEFACYLPEVEKRRLHRKYGFHSVYEYAGRIAGMNHETVDSIMSVHKKLTDKPILKDMIGEFGWGKLKVVSAVATPETQIFWAEKIKEMSKATLVTFLKELREQERSAELMSGQMGTHVGEQAGTHADGQANGLASTHTNGQVDNQAGNQTGDQAVEKASPQAKNVQIDIFTNFADISALRTGSSKPITVSQKSAIAFKLDDETETNLRIFKQRLEKETREPKDWNEVMKELLKIADQHENCAKRPQVANRHANSGKAPAPEKTEPKPESGIQSMLNKIKKSLPAVSKRHIPATVKKYLTMKHGGKCAFPACKYPAETDHHAKRFSLHPNHNPDHIVPLCKNHERIAHHGLIKNEEQPPENWKIRLEPDKNSPKYTIDKLVQLHRAPT